MPRPRGRKAVAKVIRDADIESAEDMVVSEEENVPAPQADASDRGATPEETWDGSEGEENGESSPEEEEENDDPDAEDDEQEEDELSQQSSPPRISMPTKHPRLKIMLKLPSMSGLASSTATPTPSEIAQRRDASRDIESEDSMDDDLGASTRSTSVAGPSRMTHRQAALAGVVESADYVSLEEPPSKRKKHLNETELALRKEETARKRKNLSEKKLEDEKAETINRLLKKQSRSRAKRTAAAAAAAAAAIEADEEEADGEVIAPPVVIPAEPTTFRWISSAQSGVSSLSLSIPESLLEVTAIDNPTSKPPEKPRTPQKCSVKNCNQPKKYIFTGRASQRPACGFEHWKLLQAQEGKM